MRAPLMATLESDTCWQMRMLVAAGPRLRLIGAGVDFPSDVETDIPDVSKL